MSGVDNPLYPDDCGSLPRDTRELLVTLMRGPALDGQRSPNQWNFLMRDLYVAREFLANLFLELVVDEDQQIAFVQQAETLLDTPTLLRRRTLAFRESVLLLFMRSSLAVADASGERCVLDRSLLVEYAQQYRQADDNDAVKFDKQTEAAIEKLVKMGLLHKMKNDDARYEVSQVLRMQLTLAEVEKLTAAYTSMIPGVEPTPTDADQLQTDSAIEDDLDVLDEKSSAAGSEGALPTAQPEGEGVTVVLTAGLNFDDSADI